MTTQSQESFFRRLQHTLPSGTRFDAEPFSHGAIMICFDYNDPRPSRNGLVDDGIHGHVIIGPRGGFNGGCAYYDEPFSRGDEWHRGQSRDFWITLAVKQHMRHRFIA